MRLGGTLLVLGACFTVGTALGQVTRLEPITTIGWPKERGAGSDVRTLRQPAPPPRIPAPSTNVVAPSTTIGSSSSIAATGEIARGYPPALPVAPLAPAYEVRRGLFGQPVIHVSGQPVRNFLRKFGL